VYVCITSCVLLTPGIVSVWMFRYHAIKELDRKIRDFLLPPQTVEAIRGGPGADPRSVPLSASMLSYMLGVIGDVSKIMSFRIQNAAGTKHTF
jgi:hypothetical protein